MGAYYQWQLKKDDKIEVIKPDWLKFLESFWHFNDHTQAAMIFIKEAGKPVVVNTVCDYDDHREWLDQTIKVVEDQVEPLTSGYLVNDKTKTYFSLAKFVEFRKDHNWLISPLALLTRFDVHAQGGGDFDVDDLTQDLERYGAVSVFNPELVGSWADSEVRYTDEPVSDYQDISAEIACYEKD